MTASITTTSLLEAAINAIKQGRTEDALYRLDLVLTDVKAMEQGHPPLSSQTVLDRFIHERRLLAKDIGYPDGWDQKLHPTLTSALNKVCKDWVAGQ